MSLDIREPFDFETFAMNNDIHPASLRRHWDRLFRLPPLQHLMELRMRRARDLLVESRLSVKEIGFECGFSDQLYFSRYFRKRMGLSPLNYRKASLGRHVDQ